MTKYHDIDENLIKYRAKLLDAFLEAVSLIEKLDPEREHANKINEFDALIDRIMEAQQ